jgi:hypothetical protein
MKKYQQDVPLWLSPPPADVRNGLLRLLRQAGVPLQLLSSLPLA